MSNWLTRSCAITLMLSCLGCTGIPDGLEPIGGFETDRYLGTWYEIARLDHSFERGLQDVSATYTLREEDDGIRVRNRGYDTEKGEWKEAIGKAYALGDPGVASLKVSFFGPFYGGYHVIELDASPDGDRYDVAMISGPSLSYLWILAREKELSAERTEALVAKARAAGFEVEGLIWVEHTRQDPEQIR